MTKSKFGSKPIVSDKFLKSVCDYGLTDKVLQFAEFKDNTMMKRQMGKEKIRQW